MDKTTDTRSLAEILGPWIHPGFDSGLINRCKRAWDKPIGELTNEELATLLRQNIAVPHLLPIAKERVQSNVNDGTEMYEGELKAAVLNAG